MKDKSLVFFTLASQAAAGMMIWLAFLSVTGSRLLIDNRVVSGLVLALSGSAMLVSLIHLGSPLKAWHAVRNLLSSWLSREILVASAFCLLAGVLFITDLLSTHEPAGSYRFSCWPGLDRCNPGSRVAGGGNQRLPLADCSWLGQPAARRRFFSDGLVVGRRNSGGCGDHLCGPAGLNGRQSMVSTGPRDVGGPRLTNPDEPGELFRPGSTPGSLAIRSADIRSTGDQPGRCNFCPGVLASRPGGRTDPIGGAGRPRSILQPPQAGWGMSAAGLNRLILLSAPLLPLLVYQPIGAPNYGQRV